MIFGRNMSTKKRLCYCFISVMVILSYLCLGSLVFTAIERPQQLENETPEIKTLERILDNLDKVSDSCNSSDSSGDMEQSFFDLLNETKELTNKLLQTERESLLPWDFLTGLHFCMTAVTTIGKYSLAHWYPNCLFVIQMLSCCGIGKVCGERGREGGKVGGILLPFEKVLYGSGCLVSNIVLYCNIFHPKFLANVKKC